MMTKHILLALFTGARVALGDNTIVVQEIDPGEVISLAVSDLTPTTVQFPSGLGAVIGVGITEGGSEPANFQLNHHGHWFAIRALLPGVRTRLNVLWGGDFYVFEVAHSMRPVSVMTCVPKQQSAGKMTEISHPVDKASIQLEAGDVLRLIHRVEALDFIQGYQFESRELVSRRLHGKQSFSGFTGELTRVAYFRRYRLFVFLVRFINHRDHDLFFEPASLGVRVADTERLNWFVQADGRIPAGGSIQVPFVITFSQDHPTPVSISNKFSLVVQPTRRAGRVGAGIR